MLCANQTLLESARNKTEELNPRTLKVIKSIRNSNRFYKDVLRIVTRGTGE
jgi:hypothetical protein